MPTAAYKTRIRSQTNKPRLRLVHDGTNYTDRILDVSQINRGINLSLGYCIITVDNSDKEFNAAITDDEALNVDAILQMYFSDLAEYEPLFTGKVDNIEFVGKTAVIYIKDKMARVYEQLVGDSQNPVDYYSSAYFPASLVWLILTDYGGLDDTAGAGNVDIDYASWDDWYTWCSANDLALRARPSGQTIKWMLQKLAQISDSYIWVNGAGKFQFAPVNTPAPYYDDGYNAADDIEYTISTMLSEPVLHIHKENALNHITTRLGYTITDDKWAGSVIASGASSFPEAYDYVEEDRVIWHNNAPSATFWNGRIFAKYASPERIFTIDVPLMGFFEEIGHYILIYLDQFDCVEPSPPPYGLKCVVEEMTLFPLQGRCTLKARWYW